MMAMRNPDWYEGQAEVYCYLVKRGKPAAWFLVPDDSLLGVLSTIESEGMRHIVDDDADGWSGVWIWEKPLVGQLITSLPVVRATLPAAAYAWYTGSLFGYSVDAIEAHLRMEAAG